MQNLTAKDAKAARNLELVPASSSFAFRAAFAVNWAPVIGQPGIFTMEARRTARNAKLNEGKQQGCGFELLAETRLARAQRVHADVL